MEFLILQWFDIIPFEINIIIFLCSRTYFFKHFIGLRISLFPLGFKNYINVRWGTLCPTLCPISEFSVKYFCLYISYHNNKIPAWSAPNTICSGYINFLYAPGGRVGPKVPYTLLC